jgi:hypothetical protein
MYLIFDAKKSKEKQRKWNELEKVERYIAYSRRDLLYVHKKYIALIRAI